MVTVWGRLMVMVTVCGVTEAMPREYGFHFKLQKNSCPSARSCHLYVASRDDDASQALAHNPHPSSSSPSINLDSGDREQKEAGEGGEGQVAAQGGGNISGNRRKEGMRAIGA